VHGETYSTGVHELRSMEGFPMMRLLAKTVFGAFLFIPAATAGYAGTLPYDFVTSNTPYGIISTTLPGSPTPVSFTSTSFNIGSVPIVVDGEVTDVVVSFYSTAVGGGASGLFDGELYRYDGPQLFSGPTDAPTFLTGEFSFGDFSLRITPQDAASSGAVGSIPEPSTLALFGIGLLLGGGLLKLRLSSSRRLTKTR